MCLDRSAAGRLGACLFFRMMKTKLSLSSVISQISQSNSLHTEFFEYLLSLSLTILTYWFLVHTPQKYGTDQTFLGRSWVYKSIWSVFQQTFIQRMYLYEKGKSMKIWKLNCWISNITLSGFCSYSKSQCHQESKVMSKVLLVMWTLSTK